MKTPRDLSDAERAEALRKLGCRFTRQSGSRRRITTQADSEHHEVIAHHSPSKPGTFKGILRRVVALHQRPVSEWSKSLDA